MKRFVFLRNIPCTLSSMTKFYFISLKIMEEPNKSEEELEEEQSNSEPSEEEKTEAELEAEAEAKEEEEAEEEEEEEAPTVPLSDYTRTKDVLHRMADMVIGDEDKLAELAEDNPKLLERLKGEFPKKFKDVEIPSKQMSDEDFDARIDEAVAKRLSGSGKSDALEALQKELKMTDMEFLDIKASLSEKAEHYLKIELADNIKDAVMLAYKNLSPKKHKELVVKQVLKDISKRKKASSSGTGGGKDTKKFSKSVMGNYKKYGFDSPEQMIEYQDKEKVIGLGIGE